MLPLLFTSIHRTLTTPRRKKKNFVGLFFNGAWVRPTKIIYNVLFWLLIGGGVGE